MKILSLNIWLGGFLKEKLGHFFQKHVQDADVICIQEAYPEFEKLRHLFVDFNEYSAQKIVSKTDTFHQKTFIRKGISVLDQGTIEQTPNAGLGLWVCLQKGPTNLWITNYHGRSRPGDKLDDENRILASESLISFTQEHAGAHVIVGDFNLLNTTKSVSLFEESGLRDLIKRYAITATRNHYAWDRFPGTPQLYADYTFVSPDIAIQSFAVLPDEVSDHQAMVLNIE